jgi:predicted dehydrogenase
VRLALIGCGRVIERYHLPALAAIPQMRVSCLVDPSHERRRELAGKFPDAPTFADIEQALAAGGADAALIATPPGTHATLARGCLDAGWHVLIEKPMAGSLAEAAQLGSAAKRAGKHVAVGFNRRFRWTWAAARRLLGTAGPESHEAAMFRLAFDTRRWHSAAGLEHEATAVAALLEDVVPHQVDLLAFLFDRRIAQVCVEEVRFRRGISVELTYCVRLRDGPLVRCVAAHAPDHVELLEAHQGGHTLFVTPDAVMQAARPSTLHRRCASAWGRLIDAGHRLAGRPSATVTSFMLQHCAFHEKVHGGSAAVLADAAAGAAACATGEAIRASLVGGGATWKPVEELSP